MSTLIPIEPSALNELARLIVCAARAAYRLSLSQSNEAHKRYSQWARRTPPLGAVVYENSSVTRAETSGLWLDQVGTYRGKELVTTPGNEEWGRAEHTAEYHLIDTFDGRRVRWDDCELIRVPVSVDTFRDIE